MVGRLRAADWIVRCGLDAVENTISLRNLLNTVCRPLVLGVSNLRRSSMANPILRRLAVLSLLLATACVSAVDVAFNIDGDGHGSVQVLRQQARTAPESGLFVHGLSRPDVLVMESAFGSFTDVSAVDIGGLRAEFTRDGEGGLFVLKIPCGPHAKWRELLQVSEDEARRLAAVTDRIGKVSGGPAPIKDGNHSAELPKHFSFRVHLPGEVTSSRLRGADLPQGWLIDGARTREGSLGHRWQANVSRLEISFAAVPAIDDGELSWEVAWAPSKDGSGGGHRVGNPSPRVGALR